jgi:hypothetical protein
MAKARNATEGITAVIESPVVKSAKSKELNQCACGCGRLTKRTWYPGDDQAHKGRLLERFDGGEAEAGQELVNRGWYTQDAIDRRTAKLVDERDRKYRRQVEAEQARAAREAAKAERAAAREAAKAAS